jgi:hypothetical protein
MSPVPRTTSRDQIATSNALRFAPLPRHVVARPRCQSARVMETRPFASVADAEHRQPRFAGAAGRRRVEDGRDSEQTLDGSTDGEGYELPSMWTSTCSDRTVQRPRRLPSYRVSGVADTASPARCCPIGSQTQPRHIGLDGGSSRSVFGDRQSVVCQVKLERLRTTRVGIAPESRSRRLMPECLRITGCGMSRADSLRSLRAFDQTLAGHERTFGSAWQIEGESNGEPGIRQLEPHRGMAPAAGRAQNGRVNSA